MRLESGLAAAFARVAIANVARPYPHKLDYVLEGPELAAADHLGRHPVFGGSVHLDGLGLSRAWCLRRVAAALPPGHGRLAALHAAAEANFEPSLPHTLGGDYVGEHWLASFAALAMGDVP
jgi:hypothetical protein